MIFHDSTPLISRNSFHCPFTAPHSQLPEKLGRSAVGAGGGFSYSGMSSKFWEGG